jgi:hypothetical protein
LKSFASPHQNINKLRVKLATGRDASLVRLPPSEAALRQHILRASFQTKVWHASCLAKPHQEHEIATSLSGSPKLSKSWKSDAASFSILYTNFLPFPKKEEVHPERACAAGRTLHVNSDHYQNL